MSAENMGAPKSQAVLWVEYSIRKLVAYSQIPSSEKHQLGAPKIDTHRLKQHELLEATQVLLNILSRHTNPQVREYALHIIKEKISFPLDNPQISGISFNALKQLTTHTPDENVADVITASGALSRYFPKDQKTYRNFVDILDLVATFKKKITIDEVVESAKQHFLAYIITAFKKYNHSEHVQQSAEILRLRLEYPQITQASLADHLGISIRRLWKEIQNLLSAGYIESNQGVQEKYVEYKNNIIADLKYMSQPVVAEKYDVSPSVVRRIARDAKKLGLLPPVRIYTLELKLWQEKALGLRAAHPEWTTTKIAQELNLPTTTVKSFFVRYKKHSDK